MHVILAHEEDCQMVVGKIQKIRTLPTDEPDAYIGMINEDRRFPTVCTCKPKAIKVGPVPKLARHEFLQRLRSYGIDIPESIGAEAIEDLEEGS